MENKILKICLRVEEGLSNPKDISLTVQENTYDYLMTSDAEKIRVSAFFDQDYESIESSYAELFINEDCKYKAQVEKIIPGSRVRQDIELPGAMKKGEQLTVVVTRKPV